MSAMTPRENSVEKMQVFCPWSSFRMSAWTVPRTRSSTQAGSWSGCWSIAAFMNMARIAGAGPLIVIDTDVLGSHRSNPA
jgi:hypothetical protein